MCCINMLLYFSQERDIFFFFKKRFNEGKWIINIYSAVRNDVNESQLAKDFKIYI